MTIHTMDELSVEAVRRGYGADWSDLGYVRAVYKDDLALFNYTAAAQYERKWDWLECVSRGLILNWRTGEIVARPFDKFFNWGEGDRTSAAGIVSVTEKIDGSLGIFYRTPGGYRIATRGAFDSEQATWATAKLGDYRLEYVYDCLTPLFEIVYPDNRVVVDYGDTRALYLLGVRNRVSGEYWDNNDVRCFAAACGFPTPRTYGVRSIGELVELAATLPVSQEGWVVEFADGQRFKIKGDRYVELHRLLTGTSRRRIAEWLRDGVYDEMLAGVPDEFLEQIRVWKGEIEAEVRAIVASVDAAFESAPKGERKEFALWAMERHRDIAPYLFLRLDGRPIEPMIYKGMT